MTARDLAEAEVGAALTWSRRATSIRLDDSLTMSQLPEVMALLRSGLIDTGRAEAIARAMSDHLGGTPVIPENPTQAEADQAAAAAARWAAVEKKVVERAPVRTAAQLRADVERAAIAVDSAAAERRRQKAKQDREVRHWARPDGMGVIQATLDAESAAIIDTALTLLADSARDAAARAGTPDQRTHHQRRADALTGIFSAILDGRPLPMHWSILPVTSPIPAPGSQPGRHQDGRHQDGQHQDGQHQDGRAPEDQSFSDPNLIPESFMRPPPAASDADHGGPGQKQPSQQRLGQEQFSQEGRGQQSTETAVLPVVSELGIATRVPAWWEPPALPTQQRRRPHLVITIHAETLAGHDDLPAELSSHGAITAQAARDLARHAGSADLIILGQPANTPCHHSQHPPDRNPPDPPEGAAPSERAVPPEPTDPYRPTAAQVREVIARHRTCRYVGCNRRAELCDVDHVTPHGQDGRTCVCNLIPLCRHHHRLKTFAAWQPILEVQDTPGSETPSQAAQTVHWVSPTGRRYTVPPPDQPGTTHW